jgi:hypothetical protein
MADVSPLSTGLDPRIVRFRFVVETVAPGQSFVRVLWFSLVCVTPPMLHTHLYPITDLTTRASGKNLGTFKQSAFFSGC